MNGNKSAESTNILILGLGGIGYYLAKRLVHEGYAITTIESDSKMMRQADGILDARMIQGNAMSIECWREAEAAKMDYLIAVTNNDAVNMMASLIADRFGISRKIARVRSLEWGGEDSFLNSNDLKIDLIIHPEELAAQEIYRLIKLRAGNEIIDVAEGQIQVMATRIHENSPLAHRKLKEISKEYRSFPFRVVALARGIAAVACSGSLPPRQPVVQPHGVLLAPVVLEVHRVAHDFRDGDAVRTRRLARRAEPPSGGVG